MMDADLNHYKSTAVSLVFTLVITLTAATFGDYQNSDKILLSDVKALTLHQGRMTNSRRSSPVPQLKCVGGSAQYKFTPKTVQCTNRGSDGYDIQWECKTDMDNAYRFGHVEVTCEGYDYPNDPYILKGSCGLEYTVELTEEGRQKDGYKNGHSYSYTYKSEGNISGLFVFLGVLLAMYIIYKFCLAPNVIVPEQPEQPPPYGFRPDYMPNQGPPPPYDNFGSTSYGFNSAHPKPSYPTNNATGGGGFWTGAATGGLLGYLFGRGNNHNTYNTGWGSGGWGGSGYSPSGPTSGSFFSSAPSGSAPSSGSRMTSGFGGTTRR